ncbi:MAG: hypothetical protein QM642_07675 [Edaphocola sp.]
MSINKNNIGQLIDYLYQNRKGTPAPAELTDRWKSLPEDEIQPQLNGLFASWGMTEADKRTAIYNFLGQNLHAVREQQKEQKPTPPPFVPTPEPTQTHNPMDEAAKAKKPKWPIVAGVVALALLAFMGYKYLGYASLGHVYTITDNVLVRNDAKEAVARMDLFEVQGNVPSFQKLRVLDKEIYYRGIDNSDKTYPCRKVVLDTYSFMDYLFHKDKGAAYVNTNYVVDNVKEFNLYQTAFKEVKNNKTENAALKAIYRKIIIGSMSQDPSTENKFISLHTSLLPKASVAATYGIIKQTLKDNVQYAIIAGLSDGNYYCFQGNIQDNTFEPPRQILLIESDDETKPLQGEYRFVNRNGNIDLYNCTTNTATDYAAQKDENGIIASFKYKHPDILDTIFGSDDDSTGADTATDAE